MENSLRYLDPKVLNKIARLELRARLVVEGFFADIMQRIPFDGVRDRFQKAIEAKMG